MKRFCGVLVLAVGAWWLVGAAATQAPAREAIQAPLTPQPKPLHPRMLLSAADPFSSVSALQAKYESGERPSDDLPGWALSWLLTRDEAWARRAVDEMRRVRLPAATSSRPYIDST